MHRETRPVTVHTRRLTIRETHDSLGCGRHAHRFGSSSAAIASSSFNELPLPLLGAHRLVRDGINDVTVLRALVEHSEVLTKDHKGRQLVVHLDANRAVGPPSNGSWMQTAP
jgi:hypothetical protein